MTVQIAGGKNGIESLVGCQIYVAGTAVFDSTATSTLSPASSALFQQLTSVIRVQGSATIEFDGIFGTVINAEGTGEVEFINDSGHDNAVLCEVGTTPTTVTGSFVDAELESVVQIETGWDFDNATKGCGPAGGVISGAGLQATISTGALLNNSSGYDLPGPCSGADCVEVQTGGILTPFGTPTLTTPVATNCPGGVSGGVAGFSNNYAGLVHLGTTSGGSCELSFGAAAGTSGTDALPGFAGIPACTASTNHSGVLISVAATTTTLTFTPNASLSSGDYIYYICAAQFG